MSLNNKFLIPLAFISIFLFNTNIYSIFPSPELTDFAECFHTESKVYSNLKNISLEYKLNYYAPIIIDCDRRLGTNLNSEELVDIYIHYAINDKYLKFMNFYKNEINKSNSCNGEFLRKAYQFLDLIKDDFEIEDFVWNLYFKDFSFKNEEILILIIDHTMTDILKNSNKKYLRYVEPASYLRDTVLRNVTIWEKQTI